MGIRCCFCQPLPFLAVIIVFLYSLWLFKLSMHERRPDYRVEMLGLLPTEPFHAAKGEMYLRNIDTPLKMQNFELIEMMNETTPNELSEDAVLVISASHSGVENSYAHLLEKIQKSNEGSAQLPFYLLRKARSIFMQNPQAIQAQADEIARVFAYFAHSLLIKRLTVVSFEEGSLLTLKSLSLAAYDTFPILNKLILINPFNPTLMVCHSNSLSLVQEVKETILRDPTRTQLVNSTRIVIINTVNTEMGGGRINWLFPNQAGELVTFAGSITVSSRFMWNVYCFLKPHEYFKFEPFLWIVTKMFNEDRVQGPLHVQALYNLLLFRELPVTRELSAVSKKNMMPKCVDFQLENYKYDGNLFNAECVRYLRKENYFFNENTTIILKSAGRFELYGEAFEKLSPFDTKNKETIYMLENVLEYRRFYVVNRRRYQIELRVHSIARPSRVEMLENWKNDTLEQLATLDPIDTQFDSILHPILVCPGFALVYPHNFVPLYRPFMQELTLEPNNIQDGCYNGYDYFHAWLERINTRWTLGFNLICFTLFCSHLHKASTFSRIYLQFIVNTALVCVHTCELLIAQNLMIISIVVLLELFLKSVALLSDMVSMPKNIAAKIMWPPLVFELLRWYDPTVIISPWKVIGIEFLAATHNHNVTILFLEFGFILEYIARDLSHLQGLFLVCAWLTVTANQEAEHKEREGDKQVSDLIIITTDRRMKPLRTLVLGLGRELVDGVTACLMGVCLSEDGRVMHYLVDFYILANVLLALHHWIDEYI